MLIAGRSAIEPTEQTRKIFSLTLMYSDICLGETSITKSEKLSSEIFAFLFAFLLFKFASLIG